MGQIEEILKKYEQEKEKSAFSDSSVSEKRKYAAAWFSLFISLGTVFVLIADKLFQNPQLKFFEGKLQVNLDSLIIVIVVVLISGIVLWINLRHDKKIIVNREKQYTDICGVLEIFSALENKIEIFSNRVFETSKNLAKAPVSNFISWDTSERYEKHAKKVWSFSYSLNWLDDIRIKEKCEELLLNTEDEYRYILAEENVSDRDRTIRNITDVINKFDSERHSNVKDRFLVKCLKSRKILFPVPNDVSIYQDVLRESKKKEDGNEGLEYNSIVVISTEEILKKSDRQIRHNRENINNEKYDILFKDPAQVQRVIDWFNDIWNKTK